MTRHLDQSTGNAAGASQSARGGYDQSSSLIDDSGVNCSNAAADGPPPQITNNLVVEGGNGGDIPKGGQVEEKLFKPAGY